MHKLVKVLLMKRGSLPLELLVDDQLDRGRVLVHDAVAGHVRRELVLIVSFTLVLLVQLVERRACRERPRCPTCRKFVR